MPLKGYYTKKEVKARGWSDAMVEDFLGDPDGHHHYGRGIVASLFAPARVTATEARTDWQIAARIYKLRSLKAKQGVTTRTRRLIESIKAQPVRLPRYTPEKLMEAAIQHRNNLAWDRCERRQNWEDHHDVKLADIPLWPDTHAARDRWCVNYLRHCHTSYDHFRRAYLPGRAGQAEALATWWQQFVEAVRTAYPFLEAEAKRQSFSNE